MNNYLQHFLTITEHKWEVFKPCCVAGIPWRGLVHDLSKYGLIEFFTCGKYYKGTSSPINEERKQNGYSVAWVHHKSHNPHHYLYWLDMYAFNETLVPMPYKYALEMICDWIGAGKVYGKKQGKVWTTAEPFNFLLREKQIAKIHPATYSFVYSVTLLFKDEGYRVLRDHKRLKRLYKESLE